MTLHITCTCDRTCLIMLLAPRTSQHTNAQRSAQQTSYRNVTDGPKKAYVLMITDGHGFIDSHQRDHMVTALLTAMSLCSSVGLEMDCYCRDQKIVHVCSCVLMCADK
jgi:hypothetical protein